MKIAMPIFELQEGVKDEVLLLPYGRHETVDGELAFDFKPEDAQIAESIFEERKRPLLFDFEHQSLGDREAYKNFKRADGLMPASGWAKELVATDAGLVAKGIKWVGKTAEMIASGAYRYFSPVLIWGEGGERGGRVRAIHSVALTNEPRLMNIPALAAKCDLAEFLSSHRKEELMLTPEVAGALGIKTDATDQDVLNAVKALRTKADAGETAAGQVTAFKTTADKVPALETKVAELTTQATASAAEIAGLKTQLTAFKGTLATAVLDFAVETGRITPAAKDQWKGLVEANPTGALTALKSNAAGSAVPTGRITGTDTKIEETAGGAAKPGDPLSACKATLFDPARLKVHQDALAYQEAHKGVTYGDAVCAVTEAKA